MKNILIMAICVLFTTSALSQSNTIIFSTSGNKSTLKVPVSEGESPSVLVNPKSGVIAFGGAAKIVAQKMNANTPEENSKKSLTLSLKKIALSTKSQYIGSLTEISPRIYITAAHVLNKLNDKELDSYAQALGLGKGSQLFQPRNQEKFLDIAILTDLSAHQVKEALMKLTGDLEIQSGDEFYLSHYVQLDSRLVEQESHGILSLSKDANTLYLPTGLESFLNWGSSGSAILIRSNDSSYFGGVVQCVVKSPTASSQSAKDSRSYFRGISSRLILEAELVNSQIQDLTTRATHYGLEKCNPVSAIDEIGDGESGGGNDGGGM